MKKRSVLLFIFNYDKNTNTQSLIIDPNISFGPLTQKLVNPDFLLYIV
jgi:hypothetical protein